MVEKEAVTEILTYWEQLGLEKGREEGREEGQIQAMRKITLALIESRFGAMPKEDRSRLDQLSTEALERLALAVVNVESYAKLRHHLTADLAK